METKTIDQIALSLHRTGMACRMDRNQVRRNAKESALRLAAIDLAVTLAHTCGLDKDELMRQFGARI